MINNDLPTSEITKKYRFQSRLSFRAFGEALGVTGQSIYNWEHGTMPDPLRMVQIAAAHNDWRRDYAVEILTVMGLQPPAQPTAPPTEE